MPAPTHPPRGAGSLPVLLIWLTALTLLLLYSHQALLFEQRSVAHQLRAAQAMAAAEAGHAWAVAQLQRGGGVDAQCEPVSASTGASTSLRERLLQTTPTAAGCALQDDRWACACPATGAATLAAANDGVQHPAFIVQLEPLPDAAAPSGAVRVHVTGCNHIGLGCGGSARADAQQRLHTLLAPLGGLLHLPEAALTALGSISLGASPMLANPDGAEGGWTARAGGTISSPPGARLLGPPGRPGTTTVLANDPALNAADPDGSFWRRHFGSSASLLRAQPQVTQMACTACSAADVEPWLAAGHTTLWLTGALTLSGSVHWGSAERPILLIVDGTLTGQAEAQIHGLVIAGQVQWPGSLRAQLRGALVSLGHAQLSGALEVVHDRPLLERLSRLTGALVPVPGSWQDFDHRDAP